MRLSIPKTSGRIEFASARTRNPRSDLDPVVYVNPHKQRAEFTIDEDVLQFRIDEYRKYVSATPAGTPEQCIISPELPTGLSVEPQNFACVIEGSTAEAREAQDYILTAINGDGEDTATINIGIGNERIPPPNATAMRAFVNGRAIYRNFSLNHSGQWRGMAFDRKDTLRLHSKPDAPVKVFIDVDGHTHKDAHVTDHEGRVYIAITPQSYLVKEDPEYGDDDRHIAVQQLWHSLATVYEALDIDVTTEDPGFEGLARRSAKDESYGTRYIAGFGSGYFDSGSASHNLGWLTSTGAITGSLVYGSAHLSTGHNSFTAIHEFGHTIGFSHAPDSHGSAPDKIDGISRSGQPKGQFSEVAHCGVMPGPLWWTNPVLNAGFTTNAV